MRYESVAGSPDRVGTMRTVRPEPISANSG